MIPGAPTKNERLGTEYLVSARTVMVVADDAEAKARAERSVADQPDLRAASCCLGEAVMALAEMPSPALALIACEGLNRDKLSALGALIAACQADGLPAIVTLASEQLDDVAGMLLGGHAILLCDAGETERATQIAAAAAQPALALHDSSQELVRRQRLHEEIARFAATLTEIVDRDDDKPAGLIEAPPFVADQTSAFNAQALVIDPAELRRVIRARSMRNDVFGLPGLFEDPAWDMLLDLFAAELERRSVSVSSLCIAAAVAPTTALRWIGKLIDAGLLERQPDAFDKRRAFILLTARASLAMHKYVGAVHRAGLAVV